MLNFLHVWFYSNIMWENALVLRNYMLIYLGWKCKWCLHVTLKWFKYIYVYREKEKYSKNVKLGVKVGAEMKQCSKIQRFHYILLLIMVWNFQNKAFGEKIMLIKFLALNKSSINKQIWYALLIDYILAWWKLPKPNNAYSIAMSGSRLPVWGGSAPRPLGWGLVLQKPGQLSDPYIGDSNEMGCWEDGN